MRKRVERKKKNRVYVDCVILEVNDLTLHDVVHPLSSRVSCGIAGQAIGLGHWVTNNSSDMT